ncbi:Methylamine utilisation protein MauE [Bacillus sp. 491mf]|uniref:MauE/DoxX family redox-associated membrane protein n=1 Tax=Bacillus sp. 491mf TaxID=1761755 RepID=UPI0008EE18CC|nr:Methylamine utilisation protein MauE [Bacillus sp. 491mf]
MEIIFTTLCFSLGLLFSISILDKVLKFKEHLLIVKNYKLIPEYTVAPFTIITIFLELYLSCCLFLLNVRLLTVIIGTTLLLVYTVGISINLLRKHTNISCGCGGILNSKQLSVTLVWRNVALISSLWVTFFANYTIQISSLSFVTLVFSFFVATNIILLLSIFKDNIETFKTYYNR